MSDETVDPVIRAADFRRRVLLGEAISAEEYRDAIATIRTIRRQRADAKPRAAKGKVTIDTDSLLNDLI